MPNKKNLKPLKKGELSSEEAKKRGSAGGKKSVEVRAKRKLLKEELKTLLTTLDKDGATVQSKISLALIQEASKGNVKAFEVIRDTIGEKPIDKVLNAETTPEKLNIVVDEAGIQKAIERTRNLAEDG